MGIQTGHGSTMAFGTTSTFSPAYTTLGGVKYSRQSHQTSGLATTGAHTMIEGDLYTLEPQTHEYLMDPETLATTEANAIDDLLFDSGNAAASETITQTLANAGASTFAGSGHVTELDVGQLTTDQLILVSLTTQWNDAPTITE